MSGPLRSHWVAAGGVLLAAAAGVLIGEVDPAPATPSAAPAPRLAPQGGEAREGAREPAAGVPRLALERLRRAAADDAPVSPPDTDLFAGRSWQPPAPPPPAPVAPPPAAPPAPVAPPLPFVYVGTLAEDGQEPVYYLEHGAQVLTLKAGATIGSDYRFDGLRGAELEFHYLPLDQRQTLRIRE